MHRAVQSGSIKVVIRLMLCLLVPFACLTCLHACLPACLPGHYATFRLMRKVVKRKMDEESFRVDLHRRLVYASQQCDAVAAVHAALGTALSALMRIVLRDVKSELEKSLQTSLTALRNRLYEGQQNKGGRGLAAASFKNGVVIPVFKLFGSTVHKMLQEGSSSNSPARDSPAAALSADEVVLLQQARQQVHQKLVTVRRLLAPAQVVAVV